MPRQSKPQATEEMLELQGDADGMTYELRSLVTELETYIAHNSAMHPLGTEPLKMHWTFAKQCLETIRSLEAEARAGRELRSALDELIDSDYASRCEWADKQEGGLSADDYYGVRLIEIRAAYDSSISPSA